MEETSHELQEVVNDDTNWTGLLSTYCVLAENLDDVRKCLDNGADPNKLHFGRAPIHLSAERGRHDFIQVLLEFGAKPSRVTRDGESVIHCAIRGVIQALATESQAISCIQQMTSYTYIFNIKDIKGESAIALALNNELYSIVQLLIQTGVCIDHIDQDKQLIREKIQKKYPDLIENIPVKEPVPNVEQIAIKLLESEKEDEFIELINMYDFEGVINKIVYVGHTLLHIAVKKNLLAAVNKLLECGADANVYSQFGWAALHLAVEKNNYKICQLLLQYGSNPNASTSFRKETPLHLAAKWSKMKIIKLLIDHDANIFHKDADQVPCFTLLDDNYIQSYLDKKISLRKTSRNENSALVFDYSFLTPECGYKRLEPEMECLLMLAILPKFRHFLKHPIFRSFLLMKWYRIYWMYYLSLMVYICFACTLCASIFYDVSNARENANITTYGLYQSNYYKQHLTVNVLLVILLSCICFWQIVKFMFIPYFYQETFERVVEITLYSLVLFWFIFNLGSEARHNLSAIIVLLTAMKFLLHAGRHPNYSVFITIFLKVFSRVLKFLLFYLPLFCAFAFAFYIIFYQCRMEQNEDCNLFHNISTSVFKTLIMMQGDFDLNILSLTTISFVVFTLFVLFIVIVLANIINALAISDTKPIIDESCLVSYVSQVYLYYQLELTFLSKKEIPIHVFRKLRCILGNNILLLSGYLPDKKVLIILEEHYRLEPNVGNLFQTDYCQCVRNNDCFNWFLNIFNCSYIELTDCVTAACRLLSMKGIEHEQQSIQRKLERLNFSITNQVNYKVETLKEELQLSFEEQTLNFKKLEKYMQSQFAKQSQRLGNLELKLLKNVKSLKPEKRK